MKQFDFDRVVPRRGSGSLKWDSQDASILPMWVADMDFPVPSEIAEAIHVRGNHGIFGYGAMDEGFFRFPLRWQQARHGWHCKEEWVLFSPGVVPSLGFILQALIEKGEGVIIQTPVYYPFFSIIKANGRRVVENPLVFDGKSYTMDFEGLEKLAAQPDVKALFLCSPHNPVGRVWTDHELLQLGNICAAHNVLVVSDEIHQDIVFPGHRHRSFASLNDGFLHNSVTCVAPSKTFNMAGLQCSFMIVPNQEKRDRINQVLQALHISRPNVFALKAVPVAYERCGYWVDAFMAYLEGNLAYLREFCASHLPQVKVVEPQGTYLGWMDFRAYGFSQDDLEQRMLRQGKIWLDEGYIFGTQGEGFERIVLACPRSILQEGLGRIQRAMEH